MNLTKKYYSVVDNYYFKTTMSYTHINKHIYIHTYTHVHTHTHTYTHTHTHTHHVHGHLHVIDYDDVVIGRSILVEYRRINSNGVVR